jgi:aryl-alcohol dehydrogenase-like predicted oxidoreductase
MAEALTRRGFATMTAGAAGSLLSGASWSQDRATQLIDKTIPRSGERIRAVGLGTAAVFNTADTTTRNKAADVIAALVAGGGRLIDTASTYGDAERVIGDVVASGGQRDKVFIATKLDSPSADELKRSRARLKTDKLDLLQLHNVHNPKQSLARFKEWQKEGICRFVGITSTFHGDLRPSNRSCNMRPPIFCRSTIPSTTASRNSAYSPPPPK